MKRGEVWLIDLGLSAKARPAFFFNFPFDDNELPSVPTRRSSDLNAAGRGSFGNPAGGGRRWVELRIVFESAGLFHGEVINAGSRRNSGRLNFIHVHYNYAVVCWQQRIMQREQPASSMR